MNGENEQQQKTSNPGGNQEPRPLIHPPYPSENTAEKKEEPKGETAPTKPSWFWRRKTLITLQILFNLGILATTTLQFYYARKQWEEMGSQTKSMQDQLTAFQGSIDLQRQQLEASSGAILVIRDPFDFTSREHQIMIALSNHGPSVATGIQATVTVSLSSIPNNKPLGMPTTTVNPVRNLAPFNPNDPEFPGSRFQWWHPYTVTAQESRMIENGEAAIVADLAISYNNGFNTIRDGACYAHLGYYMLLRRTATGGTETSGDDRTALCWDLPNVMIQVHNSVREAQRRRQEYQQQAPN